MRENHQEIQENNGEKAQKIINEAGVMLKEFFLKREKIDSTSKGGVDLLTEADTAIDEFLIKKLSEAFPGSQFLTEETAPKDLNYDEYRLKENLWIIDPIDGTVNFTRGDGNFAISAALVNKGETELAFIVVPQSDKVYFASKNEPEAKLNGKIICVSDTDNFKNASIAIDWPWDLSKRPEVVRYAEKLAPITRQIKMMGSAVADIAKVGAGELDAYIHAGLKPWDAAAASLVAKKAGAKITNTKGGEWDIFTPDILVTNGKLHDQILEKIK